MRQRAPTPYAQLGRLKPCWFLLDSSFHVPCPGPRTTLTTLAFSEFDSHQLGLTTVRGELRARLVLDERMDLRVHRQAEEGGHEKELHLVGLKRAPNV